MTGSARPPGDIAAPGGIAAQGGIATTGALLAIDTAIGTSVALARLTDGVIGNVVEAASENPMAHAEAIGPLLEQVFDAGVASPAEVVGVVAGVGPGPFTGLRIGIAAAHAFARGRRIPLLPLQGHEAVALEVLGRGASDVRVVQDARRRELFVTEYSGIDEFGLPRRVGDPHLVSRAEYVEAERDVWPQQIYAADLARLAALRLAAMRPFEPQAAVYLREPDVKLPGTKPSAGPGSAR